MDWTLIGQEWIGPHGERLRAIAGGADAPPAEPELEAPPAEPIPPA